MDTKSNPRLTHTTNRIPLLLYYSGGRVGILLEAEKDKEILERRKDSRSKMVGRCGQSRGVHRSVMIPLGAVKIQGKINLIRLSSRRIFSRSLL
jgi:hypothetical protein